MIFENVRSKNSVFYIWGALDALYLVWYIGWSLKKSKIPYVTDAQSSLALLEDQGAFHTALVFMSWSLQISIILSCVLFFLRRVEAVWLSYLQIPFRLIFVVPSVSILLIGGGFFSGYHLILTAVLIVLSEVLKGWSLWKFGKSRG